MGKLLVPETVAELQEIMNTPAKAAEWIQNGQFSEVIDRYREKTTPEFAEQVKDQLAAFFEGQNLIENKVKDSVQAVLKEHGVNRPAMATETSKASARYNPLAPGVAMDEIGFANIGDFARSVFNKGRTQDERYTKAVEVMNAYSSSDPASAGFLIPEEQRAQIMELALEQSIVRSRASVISMTSASQAVPFVDETTHVGSVFGGMSFSWTEESGAINASEAKFGRVKLIANKLTGLARVPNELWADAPALADFLMRSIPSGLAFFEDIAFLSGNGAGQPLGVQNPANTALITVQKESNQPTNTIIVENILKMYARMLPQGLPSSVFLASPSTFPQLMQLSIPVGTGGAPVALVDIHASPTMTLLGRPLILTEKVPALSSAGDIGLYSFPFYLVGDRQSVSLESSEHSRFANDETELRAITRVDGKPWIQSPLTPANGGDSLSPFVILGAR